MLEEKNEIAVAWEETGKVKIMNLLKGFPAENLNGMFQSEDKILWRKAFDTNQEKGRVLICADERVMPLPGEFKIGTAGQLILGTKNYQNSFVESFRGKIKAVRSHSGCGAAGIAYSKLSQEEKQKFILVMNELALQGLPMEEVSQADIYGAYHSYDLAKKLEANFEHTAFGVMRGYKGFHDARIIFWSADPTFDPSELVGEFLAPHFLANGLAFGLDEEFCKEEMKILAGIALGEHGFGGLFNANNPFYLVSVGKNVAEAQKLNENAKEAMKEFGDRISFKYISSE